MRNSVRPPALPLALALLRRVAHVPAALYPDDVGRLRAIRATWQGRPFTVVRGEPRPAG